MILNKGPTETAKEVWEVGKKIRKLSKGNENEVISQLVAMEKGDRQALGRFKEQGGEEGRMFSPKVAGYSGREGIVEEFVMKLITYNITGLVA